MDLVANRKVSWVILPFLGDLFNQTNSILLHYNFIKLDVKSYFEPYGTVHHFNTYRSKKSTLRENEAGGL
jgi:hypothetical protein